MPELYELLDESYDDESYDDESYDDEVDPFDESLDDEGILDVLLPGVGTVLQKVAPSIGSLLGVSGGRAPKRTPLPTVKVPTPGQGVSTATLNTPAGSATLALPSSLVRQVEFNQVTKRLQDGINRNTSRLNTVSGDVAKLRQDFTAAELATRQQVAKLRSDTKAALVKARKQQNGVLVRLRKQQSEQQMTNLMITMMMQQNLKSDLASHTHPTPTGPADIDDGNDSMMMLLPMMMMQDTGGTSNDNNMMMVMMMMMAMKD